VLGVLSGHILSVDDMADILSSDKGAKKNVGNRQYYALVNKCDDDEKKQLGERVKAVLEKRNVKTIVCSLKTDLFF
jgi:hypothetical protein